MILLILVVRVHRPLLVLSTVGLGVAGSKVADGVGGFGWWLLLFTFAATLWLSDVARQIDDRTRELVRSTRVSYDEAAGDFLHGSDTWRVAIGGVVILITLAAGLWSLSNIPYLPWDQLPSPTPSVS